MKLSMWILADWLAKYKPSVNICEGQPILSGARLFSVDKPELNESIVYVGYTSDFYPDKSSGIYSRKKLLCINKQDWIVFNHECIEDVLNDILEAFDFYNKWETAIKEAAYSRKSFQTLFDLSQPIFKNPMLLVDWRGKVLAMSYENLPNTAKDVWDYILLNGYLPAYAYGRLKKCPAKCTMFESVKEVTILNFPEYDYRCIHFNIHYKHEPIIYCHIIEDNIKLTHGMKHLAAALKQAISTMIRFTNIPVNQRPTSMLFSDILSGKSPDNEAIRWVKMTLGWENTEKWYLVSFRNLYPDRLSEPVLLQLLERYIPQGFYFSWKNYLIMLIDCKEWLNIFDTFCRQLNASGFRCGVSMAFGDLNDLPTRLKQAEIALKYSKEQDTVSMCTDYAWSYLFNEVTEIIRSEKMIHPAIERLVEYDNKNGTELARTLYEYLLNERNSIKTANSLYLHRNSLRYRLERISELIDADLENPDVRMHIMFSYQVKEPSGPNEPHDISESLNILPPVLR